MPHELWTNFAMGLLSLAVAGIGAAMLAVWRRSTPERAEKVDEAVIQVERNKLAIEMHKLVCPQGVPAEISLLKNEIGHIKEDTAEIKAAQIEARKELSEGLAQVTTSVSGQFITVLQELKRGNGA